VLVNEITDLIGISPLDAQTAKTPVRRTEQWPGSEQIARVVEVSEMRHMLVLQSVQGVVRDKGSVRAEDQQSDGVTIELHCCPSPRIAFPNTSDVQG
jgi:hypothetical protein